MQHRIDGGEAKASPPAASPRRPRTPKPRPEDLPLAEQRRLGLELAAGWLATREHSAAEVREKLRKKGFDREVVLVVVDRLIESKLLSDARFADAVSADLGVRRGYAPSEVRRRLRTKGVEPETAAAATAASEEEEEARAREAARKKVRALASYPPEVARRRLLGFLARRGYGSAVAYRIAAELVPANDSSDQ